MSRPQLPQDDNMLVNILPLYHMFQSTISKKLEPREENFKEDPPTYEMSPLNSAGITPVNSNAGFPFPQQLEDDDESIFHQGSADLWERTVLANVHKLEYLSEKSPVSRNLNIEIHFTESVGQKGVAPQLIDISNREFQQGDYIHGFVTIENLYHEPIPFDMVYVVFEGTLAVVQATKGPGDTYEPPTVYKFLNMIDLFALWSYANIDRLATDNQNPHDWCEGETDPYDDTILLIDVKRLFQPGIKYKRFFSFRVPEKLLDDNCEIHSLDAHCQLLPLLGHPVSLQVARRHQPLPDRKLKDFSLLDTFITYNVATRIIGRASHYVSKFHKDHYVMAKETNKPIRMIPLSGLMFREPWHHQIRAHFKALVETVEDKIQRGRLVLQQKQPSVSLTPMSSHLSPTRLALAEEKSRQLHGFQPPLTKMADSEVYQHVSPYRKRLLTGFSKSMGVFSLMTPKTEYCIPYVPPAQFRMNNDFSATVQIPVELMYSVEADSQKQQPPEPKKITCELVALSVRSKKHFIPVEFNHEMCFRDYVVDDPAKQPAELYENFDSIVIQPFNEYYHHIVGLMKRIGFDNESFKVETQLFRDIKSLAMLQTKSVNLVVPDVVISDESGVHKSVSSVPWQPAQSVNSKYNLFTKKMELTVNFASSYLKGTSEPSKGKTAFDYFCLIPDFQSCLMARFYYVRIMVKHANGTTQLVNVPVTVRN